MEKVIGKRIQKIHPGGSYEENGFRSRIRFEMNCFIHLLKLPDLIASRHGHF